MVKVEEELSKHKTEKKHGLQISYSEYKKSLNFVKKDKITIKNESKQAMTMIAIDCVENRFVSEAVCRYLENMAGETSLNHMIRVKNGLTYGLYFSPSSLSYKPYVIFGCDVSRGTQEKMEELFKESISASSKEWNQEKYGKFIKALSLKRTLSLLNQKNYGDWFDLAYQQPEIVENYKDILAKNLNQAYSLFDKELLSFENMKKSMQQINEAVQNGNYGKVTN